jgi:hypothetical protein
VADGSARGPNVRDIESLRIERPVAARSRRRLIVIAAVAVAAVIVAGAGYAIYT